MGPSSQDMAAAILGIITHYEWTSLLVLYDGELSFIGFLLSKKLIKLDSLTIHTNAKEIKPKIMLVTSFNRWFFFTFFFQMYM